MEAWKAAGSRRVCRRAAEGELGSLRRGEAWSGGLLVVLVGSLALWRVSGYTRHIPLAGVSDKSVCALFLIAASLPGMLSAEILLATPWEIIAAPGYQVNLSFQWRETWRPRSGSSGRHARGTERRAVSARD